MKEFRSVQDLQQFRASVHNRSVGFVPTMGALHQGHLSLIEKSQKENDITIVSIYLNETQFNDRKDLATYPSNLEQDIYELKQMAVTALFLPKYQDMYPDNYNYQVHEKTFSQELCGQNRPGHFDGVLTVVLKLLNIVEPTKAYFGEKDYQQLTLIKGMVESFFMKTEIIACPIQRNEAGLALSSRNKKLSPQELEKAELFAKLLKQEKDLNKLNTKLTENHIDVDYLKVINKRRFAAVRIGSVRLIDNVEV